MFNNVGKSLKTFAGVILCFGIIASVILSIVMFVASGKIYDEKVTYIGYGFGVLIGGIISSTIQALTLYGLGELIDNSKLLIRNISAIKYQQESKTDKINDENDSSKHLHNWRCPKCGTMISEYPCQKCRYEFETDK